MIFKTYAEREAYLEEATAALREVAADPDANASSRVLLPVWPAFFRAFDDEIRAGKSSDTMLFVAHVLALNILEHALKTCIEEAFYSEVIDREVALLRCDLKDILSGRDLPGFKQVHIKAKVS